MEPLDYPKWEHNLWTCSTGYMKSLGSSAVVKLHKIQRAKQLKHTATPPKKALKIGCATKGFKYLPGQVKADLRGRFSTKCARIWWFLLKFVLSVCMAPRRRGA